MIFRDVADVARAIEDARRMLDGSPRLRAYVEAKLREGIRDWPAVKLIKHPDGSYSEAE